MDPFALDLDDLEPFPSCPGGSPDTDGTPALKSVLHTVSADEDSTVELGSLGKVSSPLDIAFPALQSSVLTLKPTPSSSKGKSRMVEDSYDHAFEHGFGSPSDSSPMSFYSSSSHHTPSSLPSIAGTSYGMPSSFPIMRNLGYQDDQPPVDLDKSFDTPSLNMDKESIGGDDLFKNALPFSRSESDIESFGEVAVFSSPEPGPSSPFSGLSSGDRSFWDQFEPERIGDEFDNSTRTFEVSLPQGTFEEPWNTSETKRVSRSPNIELIKNITVSGITPRPSRAPTPLPQATTVYSQPAAGSSKAQQAASTSASGDRLTSAPEASHASSAPQTSRGSPYQSLSRDSTVSVTSTYQPVVTSAEPVAIASPPTIITRSRRIIRPQLSLSSLSIMSSGSGSSRSFKSFRLRPGLTLQKIKEFRKGKAPERVDGSSPNLTTGLGVEPTKSHPDRGQTLVKKLLKKDKKASSTHRLSEKDRSHSAPLPLSSLSRSLLSSACTSAAASSLAFESLEDIRPPPVPVSLFEERIPVEIKLEIFKCLLYLHETAIKACEATPNGWTLARASQEIWTGRLKGSRELVKLSLVSKSWRDLVLSPCLWDALVLGGVPFRCASMSAPIGNGISASPAKFSTEGERVMDAMMCYAGPHLRSLDLSGFYRHDEQPRTILPMYGSSFCFFGSDTRLTTLKLSGCSNFVPKPLSEIIRHSPHLRRLDLHGIQGASCLLAFDLSKHCPKLASLDISRCYTLRGHDLDFVASLTTLRVLRIGGIRHIGYLCRAIGRNLRALEVLDMNECDLDDDAVAALVDITDDIEQIKDDSVRKVFLKPREAGYDNSGPTTYVRRVTNLRHLCLSGCERLTDAACSYLAYSVPKLEFLELAGIGEGLEEEGLGHLLKTTPMIRRIDLEDASSIGDGVLEALTIKSPPSPATEGQISPAPLPGHALTHLIVSYASLLSNDALQSLIKSAQRLTCLELDNTRASQTTIKEFIKSARRRRIPHAQILAVDCRSVGEPLVRDLAMAGMTRTRRGERTFESRGLNYVDWVDVENERARERERSTGIGWDSPTSPTSPSMTSSPSSSPSPSAFWTPLSSPTGSSAQALFPYPLPINAKGLSQQHDECDPYRVVFKSFWSWSVVDSVRALREKEKKEREKEAEKERRRRNGSGGLGSIGVGIGGKWLSIGRRGRLVVGGGSLEEGSSRGSGGSRVENTNGNGNGTTTATATTRANRNRALGLVQLDLTGDTTLEDWDDRGCVIM